MRTSLTRPNTVVSEYSYDNLSRLVSVLHKAGGTTVIDGAGYTVDNAGNRTGKTNSLNGTVEAYSYDDVHQLTEVIQNINGTPTTTEVYSFDDIGNRLSSLGLSPYQYNSSNQLTSTPNATFTFDDNGNTLTKADTNGTTQYAWDFENRLTSVTLPNGGGTVYFKYDPFGRRIQKSGPSGTVNYAYDGANAIEEVNSSGAVIARYVQGAGIDEPLAQSRSGLSFYQADGLGSITALADSSGTILASYTYDAFGNVTASTGSNGNPYRYTGRDFDSETGLYYYRARYYDPATGRFLTEDPLQFRPGVNFYAFVSNDPINSSDPFGLEPDKGCKDCRGKPIQGLDVGKKCCSAQSPMPSSAPNPYMPWEGYASVNAGMMFEHGGDGPWGQIVRSCLLCMYGHGATPNQAHWYCYANASGRTSRVRATTGFVRAVTGAALIEVGQVVIAIGSQGTDIRATGPWLQFVGAVK